jgi:ABC-type sugar transport system ATPase subunit
VREHSKAIAAPKEDRKPGKVYVSTPNSNYLRLKTESSYRSNQEEQRDTKLINPDLEELKKRPSGLYLDDVIRDMKRKRQPRFASDLQFAQTPSRLFVKKPIGSQRPKINQEEVKAQHEENDLLDSDLRPDFQSLDLRKIEPKPNPTGAKYFPRTERTRSRTHSRKGIFSKNS